jgi:hypothetical protein
LVIEVSKESIAHSSGLKMEATEYTRVISQKKFLAQMFNGSPVVTCRQPDKHANKHGEANKLILASFPFGHSKYEDQ